MSTEGRRPLTVLSGFLGSGKTTLLRRAVESASGGVAVIVNELGEVGLDQRQFTHVAERTVLLDNGCLCCVTREDLRETLRGLLEADASHPAASVRRVVLETSGLADPAPIIGTIERDPVLRHQFAVDHVVVTCDAEHAEGQQARPEWHAQVASADLAVITKGDRVGPARAGAVRELVRERNPAASVVHGQGLDLLRAVAEVGPAGAARSVSGPSRPRHSSGVSTASVTLSEPVDPVRVVVWLSALLHAYGGQILRLKGLLDVGEGQGPLVLDAVQHVVYPPRHLSEWEGERTSSLVIISAGLEARTMVEAFATVVGGAAR